MLRKRKTVAQRRQEEAEAEAMAWRDFSATVRAIESLPELEAFAYGSIRDQAGHNFYSNLGYFLGHSFDIPYNSSRKERHLYLGIIETLDKTGQLKPGAGAVLL